MSAFVQFRGGPWDQRFEEWPDPPHVILVPTPPAPTTLPVTGVLADLEADFAAHLEPLARPDGRYVCMSVVPGDFSTGRPSLATYEWKAKP